MKKILCRLRVLMLDKGIRSISELQRMTKLPRMTLDRVANNEASLIDCGTTERICAALSCDITDLYQLVTVEEFEQFKHNIKVSKSYMRDGVVYFLKDKTNGFIKVGKTIDLERRISELSKMYLSELELLFAIETEDSVKLEKQIHRAFEHKRIEGELFDLNENDLRIIKSMTGS